jgi:hypothetical protein
LRDEISFPSGVIGPWDLAPLALEVADFKSDVIIYSPNPSLYPGMPESSLELNHVIGNKGALKL